MDLKTAPILLIIWRRPQITLRVLNAIRNAKPMKLYIASDGPRFNSTLDDKLVFETRLLVENSIDWECHVQYRYSKFNQGCGNGVSAAISWFFEYEECGIILEDDCLPSPNFFRFCSTMLEKYKDDKSIMHIGGVSFQKFNSSLFFFMDYYISRYAHVWGWATWKRAWKSFELLILENEYEIRNYLKILNSHSQQSFWLNIILNQKKRPIDTWDYSWQFCIWKNKSFCIYPKLTMVDNIGFDCEATHTFDRPKYLPKIDFSLNNNKKFYFKALNTKILINYLDFINFMRVFKGKKFDIFSFKNILKYIKE